jgi:prefoldin subunit 5
MAKRNNLTSKMELEIKLIMNRITPSSYSNCRKKIEAIMKEQNFLKESLTSIGFTIFNKACIEKKYTSMYSELCTQLVKTESKYLADLDWEKYQREKYEKELSKLKRDVESGKIKEIPIEMLEYRQTTAKNTKFKTKNYKKVSFTSTKI